MYAVHVVNRPLTKNYQQLLDEVFVMTRISKGKENVIGFS